MSSIKLIIPVTPKPKGSVKAGKWSFYNPSARGMKLVRDAVEKSLPPNWKPLEGPLLVICHFKMPTRLQTSGKKRQAINQHPHCIRPDGDNLEKFLNDSLNGLLWYDDSSIVWLLRSKTYTADKEGSTILFVKELPNDVPDYAALFADLGEHINLEARNVCY